MEYFAQVKTVQGATKRYRALAKKWHPDRNGSIDAGAVMAEINRQYKATIVILKSDAGDRCDSNSDANARNQGQRTHHVDKEPEQGEIYESPATQPKKSESFSRVSRKVLDVLVSDSDLDVLRDKAESFIVSAATRLVTTSFSALKRWKSE